MGGERVKSRRKSNQISERERALMHLRQISAPIDERDHSMEFSFLDIGEYNFIDENYSETSSTQGLRTPPIDSVLRGIEDAQSVSTATLSCKDEEKESRKSCLDHFRRA